MEKSLNLFDVAVLVLVLGNKSLLFLMSLPLIQRKVLVEACFLPVSPVSLSLD